MSPNVRCDLPLVRQLDHVHRRRVSPLLASPAFERRSVNLLTFVSRHPSLSSGECCHEQARSLSEYFGRFGVRLNSTTLLCPAESGSTYEFPRGIGWLPTANYGRSCAGYASAFDRAGWRQAARRPRAGTPCRALSGRDDGGDPRPSAARWCPRSPPLVL